MTDYPALYRQLAREIITHEGKIAGDANAFVEALANRLQAEGYRITPEIEAQLTDYLDAMQDAIREGIEAAVTVAVAMPGLPQSASVAKLTEQAFSERWPDGLRLSDRLWNFNESARTGLTRVLRDAAKSGESVSQTLYTMQRTLERAANGQRFKIVENYADDWVKALHEAAVAMIHDPQSRELWHATIAEAEERLLGLKATGSRSAAERVLDQIKQAVAKGKEALADKAVKWWLYDKQLYGLKRIARTEMATAMHRAVIAGTEHDDSIIGYQWRLSGSHPATDICDYYASIEMGLGKGVFTKDAVPHHKAHPHCMCLLIPRVTPIKQKGSKDYATFIKNLSPEQQKAVLPKWASEAVKEGVALEKLIRPDGLGLVTQPVAAKSGLIDSDWKTIGLLSAKQLHALPDMHDAAPNKSDGAPTAIAALSVLRDALGLKSGERKIIKTPAGTILLDDAWLPHIVEKRQAARERYADWVLPTLKNPTEIWQAPHGEGESRKRYIKLFADGKDALLVVVNVTQGDLIWNVIPMPIRSLDNQRQGKLLWQGYR